MKEPLLAFEIMKAVVEAVDLPVTVKFRKGWDNNNENAVEMAQLAEKAGVCAVAVHGRTREQYYSGQADWDIIKEVKAPEQVVEVEIEAGKKMDEKMAEVVAEFQSKIDALASEKAAFETRLAEIEQKQKEGLLKIHLKSIISSLLLSITKYFNLSSMFIKFP